MFFFFNDTATTEIYTLSLHDALPIYTRGHLMFLDERDGTLFAGDHVLPHITPSLGFEPFMDGRALERSEEHTSELQSRQYLVCRLLLEKTKRYYPRPSSSTTAHTTEV